MPVGSPSATETLLGDSVAIRNLRREVEEAAKVDSTILITGETGTGKGVVARAIHRLSTRHRSSFVHMDCGLLCAGLVESELFGHERGSFTGAIGARVGRFELAGGGSIFLDEIGDMDLVMQRKLLRVLQDREFERVGGNRTIKMTARVIAATNCDLHRAIVAERFRQDLFFRLNVFQIHVPALRERRSDIPLLFMHFAREAAAQRGIDLASLPASLLSRLMDYQWPGNVRELQNLVEQMMARLHTGAPDACDWAEVLDRHSRTLLQGCAVSIPPQPSNFLDGNVTSRDADTSPKEQWQPYRDQLAEVLRSTGGNISRAARRIGIPRSTLRYWLARYSLDEVVLRD
ncbi:MAG: sigma-54 interaction domain-containing protein [Candidatus Binataceae bacterium]